LQNPRGVSPLGIAVGFNKLEAVKLLLEKGADVAAKDAAGNTVLHYAAGGARAGWPAWLASGCRPGCELAGELAGLRQPPPPPPHAGGCSAQAPG
jgi:hypothetical protein